MTKHNKLEHESFTTQEAAELGAFTEDAITEEDISSEESSHE